MAISSHKDFDKLMDTVRILRVHYSNVANRAEQEMLKAKIKGDGATAAQYKSILRKMSDDHDTALSLIADKLTTPEELQKTRKELRSAANSAHGFIKKLKTAKLTVQKLEGAAKFMTLMVTQLRGIFGV